ncbi:MAG: exodeoxyribonuclease V subunit gamma [Clostridia bacterium]|nr:exodeoxyribonuclease V subunit gamma [Clostridia bacterium]
MALNIIYGRSGTGKSEYLYNKICDNIGKTRNFLIVPEQSNLSAERRLFNTSKIDSIIDTEVLTLSRMAHRVNSAILGNRPILSKAARSMIIYDILSRNKGNLNFLGKSNKNIETVQKFITEFKNHNISTEMLSLKTNNNYLDLKLEDARLLFTEYNKIVEKTYIDENDELTLLCQNIDKVDYYDDASFFVDEFLGFTPQEYSVFEKILLKANDVWVTVSADSLEITDDLNDIFYFNKVFANKLIQIAEDNNIEINKVFLENSCKYKSEELLYLEKNLYSYAAKYDGEVENIQIFFANNPYSELEYIGKQITQLVKAGYRYRDIGIISEELEKYSEDAKSIFRKYEIPLFVDEKKSLNQNILIKFIIAILEIYSKNWTFESVFNYLKLGLLDIDEIDIYKLENYCLKWGIKYNKWYSKKFEYEELNEEQEHLENLREKIVNPLLDLKHRVSENRTAREITKELYSFITENGINETLNTKLEKYNSNEVFDEYNTSYKLMISVLEDICNVFGDEKISFEKYKEILMVGLEACELGKIPATQDQVVFGDTERTRSGQIKVLFVVGINDGYYPKVNNSEGFFNDSDRELLKENGITMAKKAIEDLYEEQFNIYRTLLTPEEKLYLLYSSADKQGKSVRPSILIKKLETIFDGKIKVESDVVEKKYSITNYNVTFEDALNVYKEYIDGKEITDEWKQVISYYQHKEKEKFERAVAGINYTNRAEKITKEKIYKLYGDNLETTVSRLETYRRCPFSFHMTYGLKVRERREFNIESVDTGNFMHEVIDMFFKILDDEDKNVKEILDEEIMAIIDRIINELLSTSKYYKFTSTAKYRLLTRRLKKVIYATISYIVYSLKCSDFTVLGHELEFSNNGKYKKLEMDVDGKKVRITGKIDRVDVGVCGEKQYVRIIDYKSSKRKVDMKQVENGLQIQLITYLDAINKQTGYEPSGVFYLGMIDEAVKKSKNMTEEEINENIRKNFRMNGLVLADVEVVKMMDKNLTAGSKSDIIPVALTKEGGIKKNDTTNLTAEEFKELGNKVMEIIKEISREILNGEIDIKPYDYSGRKGCDFCSYKAICMFNTSIQGNEYRKIN